MIDSAANLACLNAKRILVTKLRHHGDVLLITPLLNALREHFPTAAIDVLVYQETLDMIQYHPVVNRVFCVDRLWKKKGKLHLISREWALFKSLRSQKYDIILHLSDSWRGAQMCRLLRPRWSVAEDYIRTEGSFWSNSFSAVAARVPSNEIHTIERNLRHLLPLGLSLPKAPKFDIGISTVAGEQIEKIYTAAGFGDKKIAHIHPGARWPFKCWFNDRWQQIITGLLADGYHIVLSAAPNPIELNDAKQIAATIDPQRLLDLSGQLNLQLLAASIARADIFLGVDSAPMHMAAALSIPCVAIFGPSKINEWRPWGKLARFVVDPKLAISPDDVNTSTSHRYTAGVSVALVEQAVAEVKCLAAAQIAPAAPVVAAMQEETPVNLFHASNGAGSDSCSEMPSIYHALSLNVGGGVEALFTSYISMCSEAQHLVINDRDTIHPSEEMAVLRAAKTMFWLKRFHGFKLPKYPGFLRKQRFSTIVKDAENLVLWNKLFDSYIDKRLGGFVYYDHGGSWYNMAHASKSVVPRSRKCIAVSSAGKFILENVYGAKDVKIQLNPLRFPNDHQLDDERQLDLNRRFIIGAAGRLIPVKAFEVLIDAIALLLKSGFECELHIAGEGPLMRPLLQKIKSLELQDRVFMLGRVRDMQGFLRDVDLFVNPSLHETFGLVTLEAAAFGVPVIASRVDGIEDFIEHGHHGLLLTPQIPVSPERGLFVNAKSIPQLVYDPISKDLIAPRSLSAEQIVEAIQVFTEDPDFYRRCSKNNIIMAKKFAIESYAKNLTQMFIQ